MAMPKKIKAFQAFLNGKPHPRMVKKIKLPKLGRKFEEYRADIMDGPVEIDLGGGKLESTITWEEHKDEVMEDWGTCNHQQVRLRLMASVESDDCDFDEVHIVMWGRYREIDQGDLEQGSDNTMDATLAISHYEYIRNGREILYIDRLSGVERSGGIDRTAERRKAIGMEG